MNGGYNSIKLNCGYNQALKQTKILIFFHSIIEWINIFYSLLRIKIVLAAKQIAITNRIKGPSHKTQVSGLNGGL